jgi:hypothetical protein
VSSEVDVSVYSSLLLMSLAQPKRDDSVGITNWRKQLAKFVQTLPTGESNGAPRGVERTNTIPLLNLIDGSLELDSLPYTVYAKANEPLGMV